MIIDFRFLGQNGGSQGGGVTSGDVQSIVESYNYVNSGEVETQITSKNYVTAEDIPDSTILKSVEELNSGTSIGDIQTKTAPSGDKIIFWNLEGSEGAELTIHSIPETWTDPTEHHIGQIRDKQVLGYGDDNWVTLCAYYNTTTNEPMIRVATEHSIEEYTLNEFGTSSEGNTLATFIDPEYTAHTCTIIVLEQAGIYVITVNTDEGYDPNIIYDTDEYYDGASFDGVYAKTSVSGYTKLATVEDIPDTSAFLTSADTQNFLTSADTQNFLTSADTQGFVSTSDYEEDAEVISTALNDLNTRVSGAVRSDGTVSTIVKIYQSAYNQLVSAGTISESTVYYIVADPVNDGGDSSSESESSSSE